MTIKPRAVHTRFLCPIFYPEGDHARIVTVLRGMPDTFTRSGEKMSGFLWEQASTAHSLYKDELIHPVRDFLFPQCENVTTGPGDSSQGCRYLRLSPNVAGRIFHNTVVHLGRPLSVNWMRMAGMELFLTAHGAGVLSIALTVEEEDLQIQDVLAFNYRASQLHPSRRLNFVRPHPSQDPERWARIPAEQRERIPPAPADTDSFWDRASRDGGEFTLHDLLQATVFDLLGDDDPDRETRGMMAYSVVRFGSEVDFARDEVRSALGPLVAGLAQIEEAGHAGAFPGEVPVANGLLNHNHWAAASHLGSAHLVSDQPPPENKTEHPFNAERVPRVFMKYFVAYLMSLLQNLVLRRAAADASRLLLSQDVQRHIRMSESRRRLLEFQIGGHASQVSVREAVHRYYRICGDALEVDDAGARVRQVFGEYDAKLRQDQAARRQEESARLLEHQQAMTRSMDQNLASVALVQKLIEALEVFIIAYYMTELAHLLVESHFKEKDAGFFGGPGFLGIVFASVAAIVVLVILLAHRLRDRRLTFWEWLTRPFRLAVGRRIRSESDSA